LHYKGSVVIVSHDKFFLNKMVNKIVEVYQQQLNFYTGDYEYYEVEKVQRIEIQQKAFENQQDYIRQQERFIERFKAKASKAAQAQSIQKRLDKIDKIDDVQLERPDLRINFQLDKVPGKVLVDLKNITKQFGDLTIVKNTTAEIERGDKIALIGANGKGKSTVLRIVGGTEQHSGERVWGHNVDESFYAQHQLEALTLTHTIMEEMQQCGSKKTDVELRSVLGAFLFSGDDVDKKIRVLSGGEKARVALAKTMVSKANFLLLDEPTNHLDMHSVELLAGALNKYEGSYILISHDRYFISQTANKIWEIVDHQIKEFKGTYAEWVEWNERMAAKQKDNKGSTPIAPAAAPVPKVHVPETKAPTPNTAIDKDFQKELQKQKKRLQNLELDINSTKVQKEAIEQELGNPDTYTNPAKFASLESEYKTVQQKLATLNTEYETVFEKVLEMEA
ncbi:MAG: ABC-F family ATP-binding cassette domain-containing protein, partial [Sediminibacterium sp.]